MTKIEQVQKAEGSSDNNAVIYDNGYVKIDGKMYKPERMNHTSGLGIVIQTPTKMYFLRQKMNMKCRQSLYIEH